MKNSTTPLRELGVLTPVEFPAAWDLSAIRSGQCISYVAWNSEAKEGIVIDPKDGDLEAYREVTSALAGYLWIAVIDTHTHADHVSIGRELAIELRAPLVMHARSPSTRVDIRLANETSLPSHAGPIQFYFTPGHTPDAVTVVWGPFAFTGDTVVIGDTGRDDLPGGDAETHFESIEKLKALLRADAIVLPGHDSKGSRASTWGQELLENKSLRQSREDFVRESNAYDAPAPELLKKSLKENYK